jgi:hypothetical protein
VEGVDQAILQHRVDELEAAHLLTGAEIGRMRRLAHRLLAAGHNDRRIAAHDLLIAERHRAKTRAAELIDDPGRCFNRDAGIDGSLAGRVLALGRREDLAEDDFGDVFGRHFRAGERSCDRDFAKVMRGHGTERTIKRADRRTGARNDHDLSHRSPPIFNFVALPAKWREPALG